MPRHGVSVFVCLMLPACTDTVISNGTIGGAWGRHQTPVTYTTADVRMISERRDPMASDHNLVCTEPLPDVAKALATAAQARAQGSGGGAVNVTLSGGYASSEGLLELAGRSSALLGLRDGLYRACEAYANGSIGDAAYSLLLSRYAAVMVTLFLAQDMQNAAAHATNTVQSPAITVGDGDSRVTPTPSPAQGGQAQPEGKPGNTKALAPAVGLPAMLHRVGYPDSPLTGGLAPWAGEGAPLTARSTSLATVPPTTVNPPPPATPRQPPPPSLATVPPTAVNPPPTPGAAQDQPTAGSAAVAQAVGNLAKDYFASGKDGILTLMIACINEFDATRLREERHHNEFLRDVCGAFSDTARLKALAGILDFETGNSASPTPAASRLARHAH